MAVPGEELSNPQDLFVDQSTGYVYIADTDNNRIVVTNEYLMTMFIHFYVCQ